MVLPYRTTGVHDTGTHGTVRYECYHRLRTVKNNVIVVNTWILRTTKGNSFSPLRTIRDGEEDGSTIETKFETEYMYESSSYKQDVSFKGVRLFSYRCKR